MKELRGYVEFREAGLTKKSQDWIERVDKSFWRYTKGIINKNNLDVLRANTLEKYQCEDSKSKMLSFAVAFLKYLTKTRFDNRFLAFSIFLERPKKLKQRKRVTNRIVTKQDIENILAHIKTAEKEGRLNAYRARQYAAFILFAAYTGQRSNATISKLTIEQFQEALQLEKPVIRVRASQDKIRMEHYVPLHPQAVKSLKLLLNGRADDELMLYTSAWQCGLNGSEFLF